MLLRRGKPTKRTFLVALFFIIFAFGLWSYTININITKDIDNYSDFNKNKPVVVLSPLGFDVNLRNLPPKKILYWVPVSSFMGSHMMRLWDQCPVVCTFSEDRRDLNNASAVIFHLPMFGSGSVFPNEKPAGQLWATMTMESDIYYTHQADKSFLKKFDVLMSYHLNSDIPTLYMSSRANYSQTPQPKSLGLVSVFISNSSPMNDRNEVVQEIMKHVKVDSYGRFLNNKQLDRSVKKIDVIGKYKFHLAFENSADEDYVTEKIFHCFLAGTVPIYLGAPNIDMYTPSNHSIIKVHDFPTIKDLVDYLLYLDKNDEEYNKYLAWKTEGFSDNWKKIYSIVRIESRCRLCRKVHGVTDPTFKKGYP
eukprot:TRINITY_DN1816_c0_g1_i1.p1 TRINITY_DN1816_c0_g1~~TRINITY_DN1816_c0_g1_i1.p1  ORF type:complete len:364 (-),score=45.98 TRINITY_DN1816_c0_g1_i1:66-1157(-)